MSGFCNVVQFRCTLQLSNCGGDRQSKGGGGLNNTASALRHPVKFDAAHDGRQSSQRETPVTPPDSESATNCDNNRNMAACNCFMERSFVHINPPV